MGKGSKRKTIWQPLSIAEGVNDTVTSRTSGHPEGQRENRLSARDSNHHYHNHSNNSAHTTKSSAMTSGYRGHNNHNYSYSQSYNNNSNNNSSNINNHSIGPSSSSSSSSHQYRSYHNNGHSDNYSYGKDNQFQRHSGASEVATTSLSTSAATSQTYSPHKRRPFSQRNQISRYSNGYGSGYNSHHNYHQHRSNGPSSWNGYQRSDIKSTFDPNFHTKIDGKTDECHDKNKDNSAYKRVFNEDEYTRITTPRQDVLFKKGYLSRPKKYDAQNTTNSSSSAGSGAVSVVSNEECGSHFSAQSITPENGPPSFPSADAYDPDYPLMYSPGFYDQNGYFYPFIPGMETFDGQSMILPYGGDGASMPAVPFNISPVEFDNADGAQHETSSIADSSALPTPSTASSEVPTQDSGADQKSLENKDYSDQSDNILANIDSMNDNKTNSASTEDDPNTLLNLEVMVDSSDIQPKAIDEQPQSQQQEQQQQPEGVQETPESAVNECDKIESNDGDKINEENKGDVDASAMQQFYQAPPFFYPFMMGPVPPYMPINESNTNNIYHGHGYRSYGPSNKYGRFRRRRRSFEWPRYHFAASINVDAGENTQATANGDEHGETEATPPADDATTIVDSSPNDTSAINEQQQQHPQSSTTNESSTIHLDNVINNTTLNTNVSEFIPRTTNPGFFLFPLPIPLPPLQQPPPQFGGPQSASTNLALTSKLNADVPEFRPRSFQSARTAAIDTMTSNLAPPDTSNVGSEAAQPTSSPSNDESVMPKAAPDQQESASVTWPDKRSSVDDQIKLNVIEEQSNQPPVSTATTPLLSKIVAQGVVNANANVAITAASINRNWNIKANSGDNKLNNAIAADRFDANNRLSSGNRSRMGKSTAKPGNNSNNVRIIRRDNDDRPSANGTATLKFAKKWSNSVDSGAKTEKSAIACERAADAKEANSQLDKGPTYAQMLGPVKTIGVAAKSQPLPLQPQPSHLSATAASNLNKSKSFNNNKKKSINSDHKLPIIPKSIKTNDEKTIKLSKCENDREATPFVQKMQQSAEKQKWQTVRTKGRRKTNVESDQNDHDWSDIEVETNKDISVEDVIEQLLCNNTILGDANVDQQPRLEEHSIPSEKSLTAATNEQKCDAEISLANGDDSSPAPAIRKNCRKRKSGAKKHAKKADTISPITVLRDGDNLPLPNDNFNVDHETESNASTISALADDKILVLRAMPIKSDSLFKVHDVTDGKPKNRNISLKEFCFDINPSIFGKYSSLNGGAASMRPSPFSIISATLSKSQHVLLPLANASPAEAAATLAVAPGDLDALPLIEANAISQPNRGPSSNSDRPSAVNKSTLRGTPLHRFDFIHHTASPTDNMRLVKEEEEMVIRVMRQLSEQSRKDREQLSSSPSPTNEHVFAVNHTIECDSMAKIDPPTETKLNGDDKSRDVEIDAEIDAETTINVDQRLPFTTITGSRNETTVESNGIAEHLNDVHLINDLPIESKEAPNCTDAGAIVQNGHRHHYHGITNGQVNGIEKIAVCKKTEPVLKTCNGNGNHIIEQHINTNHFLGVSSGSPSDRDKNDDCTGTQTQLQNTNTVSIDVDERDKCAVNAIESTLAMPIQSSHGIDNDNDNKPIDNNIVDDIDNLVNNDRNHTDMINELANVKHDHIDKQGSLNKFEQIVVVKQNVDNLFFYPNTVIEQYNVHHEIVDNNNAIATANNSDSDEMTIGFYSSSEDEIVEIDCESSAVKVTVTDTTDSGHSRTIDSPNTSEDSGVLELHDRIESDFAMADVPKKKTSALVDCDKRPESTVLSSSLPAQQSPSPPLQPVSQSFPITQAVSQWLTETKKEKTPEAIFRLPTENAHLAKELAHQLYQNDGSICDENNGDHDDDDEDVYFDKIAYDAEVDQNEQLKNAIGDPSDAAFRNLNEITADEWVAITLNSNSTVTATNANANGGDDNDENDLLTFWDNDVVTASVTADEYRLKRQQLLRHASPLSDGSNDGATSITSSATTEHIDVYDSVYGRSIDYAGLIADNGEILSNNILNDQQSSRIDIKQQNATDQNRTQAIPASTDPDICYKPPEVCCSLM